MNEDFGEKLARLDERVCNINRLLSGLGTRVETLEVDIKNELTALRADVQPLRDWVNRNKGAMAALVGAVTVLGGAIGALVAHFLRGP